MSAAFYPVLKDAPDAATIVDGKALSRSIELLDRLALEAGVTPLTQFVSMDGDEYGILDEEDFGDGEDIGEGGGAGLPGPTWFSAEAGLRTVRALLNAVRQQAQGDEALVQDLGALEQVLAQAAERDVQWHLAVDL